MWSRGARRDRPSLAAVRGHVIGRLAVGLSWDGSYYEADVDRDDWHGSIDLVGNGLRAYLRAGF